MEAAAALDTGCLVFIGFMGAGKSLAARTAGAALGVEAVDSDQILERRLGSSIEAYFGSHGERAFREQEEEAVSELLDAPPTPVLSLGGGAITSERVRTALARHTVVLLDVDAATAWARCRSGRPLARDRDRFEALHAERAPLYAELADAILPADRRDEVRRALPAIRALGSMPAGTKLLWAGEYPVFVGDGLLGAGQWPVEGRRFLVTDESVGELYADRLGEVARDVRIPPGEAAKTMETAGTVLRALASAGMAHDDHVVALGGGVVGDVAGFCAAVYQRGVPVVQVPTTLVAQVDSAFGGKTGVDLPEGKNYVGAYHQPAAVLADPSTLATLPREELAAGWAEVLKTGLIAGGDLWRRVRSREAAEARSRPRAGLRARQAADRRPGRARRRFAANPQPRPHGWTCDRDGHRVPALPPRRGRRARAAGRADALPAAGAARRGRGPARRPRAADHARPGGRPWGGRRRGAARQETPRRARRLRADRGAGAHPHRLPGGGGRPESRDRGAGTMRMRNRVAVMHGVNLDMLERRPPELYGDLSLPKLERLISQYAHELGLEARFFQSNFEGEYVEELHRAADYADGLVLNPGAWTHYAWALRDAVEIAGLPAVEIHISDVDQREEWRRTSVLADIVVARVAGEGIEGYRTALARLKDAL